MNTSQAEFDLTGGAPSQCAIIASRLARTPGARVSLRELMILADSGAVHSRICDLRRRGMRIRNEVRQAGRRKLSFYILETVETEDRGQRTEVGTVDHETSLNTEIENTEIENAQI